MSDQHEPVLLKEAIAGLAIKPDGIYIDATFGRGGHSQAILECLGPKGRLIAFDKDPAAVQFARQGIFKDDARFAIEQASFASMKAAIEQRELLGGAHGFGCIVAADR